MALLYVALFSLVAWAVVALVPAPTPTVATIKNLLVGVLGLIFLFWLIQHFGFLRLGSPTVNSVR